MYMELPQEVQKKSTTTKGSVSLAFSRILRTFSWVLNSLRHLTGQRSLSSSHNSPCLPSMTPFIFGGCCVWLSFKKPKPVLLVLKMDSRKSFMSIQAGFHTGNSRIKFSTWILSKLQRCLFYKEYIDFAWQHTASLTTRIYIALKTKNLHKPWTFHLINYGWSNRVQNFHYSLILFAEWHIT